MTLRAEAVLPREEILAREIRLRHASSLNDKLHAGTVKSPIRGVTAMVNDCRTEMLQAGLKTQADQLRNLAIGDINPLSFDLDTGNDQLAKDLGLNPYGTKYKEIIALTVKIEQEEWTAGNAHTRYQLEGIGMTQLRQSFADFLYGFGTNYSVEQVVLDYGGLGAINTVLEYSASEARSHGELIHLFNPVPSFNAVATQAKDIGIPVVSIPTRPENGYCITAESLELVMPHPNQDCDVLYLTPMNNPTSTIYEPHILKAALEKFHTLRPNGIIIVDLAYIEMVDKNKAEEIIKLFESTDTLNQAIMVTSMSKMFGQPRIRSGALYSTNEHAIQVLGGKAQTIKASISGPTELRALATFALVPHETREKMFNLFRLRQDKLIERLVDINNLMVTPVADLSQIHREVPLYIYLGLPPNTNFVKFFVDTGFGGVPGSAFGDRDNNIRLAVGMESFNR